jgi:hypothetical protein
MCSWPIGPYVGGDAMNENRVFHSSPENRCGAVVPRSILGARLVCIFW